MSRCLLFLVLTLFVCCTALTSAWRVHENVHTIHEERMRLGIDPRPIESGNVVTYTITQPLDHFDHLNNGTYQQTYWINEQFWDGQGPGFIYLGGEWQESPGSIEYGSYAISDWAKTFNGLMVDIQHRYYDGMNPPSQEGNPNGIQYLSSEQALADVASIVTHLNEVYAPNNTAIKWIHVGGSYAGNMAAWYRLKYPHLGAGGFAVSGPVEAIVDYTGFFALRGAVAPVNCLNYTRDGITELSKYLSDEGAGWTKILNDFNLTFSGSTKYERELAMRYWLFASLSFGYLGGGPFCPTANLTAYQYLAQMVNPREKKDVTYSASEVYGMYSWLWFYQTCTEMGYYQTGTDFFTNPNQIIPPLSDPTMFKQACHDAYGIDMDEIEQNIIFTNSVYGGLHMTTSNTFFTHGNIDSWSAAGITHGPVPVYGNTVAVILKGTHCSDLYWPNDGDSDSLKQVRQAQKDQIKAWVTGVDTAEY